MKKIMIVFLVTAASVAFASQSRGSQYYSPPLINDITDEIPVIISTNDPFEKVPNVAQYKNADWSNATGMAKGISEKEPFEISNDNPEITFFFRTKGGGMFLETTEGDYRVFNHGDTVFFTGEPWWGSAPDLADGYIRRDS